MADEPKDPETPVVDPKDATLKATPEPWYKTGGFDESHQKVLSKYPTPEEAHKALVAAQPLIHGKITLPKDDATPEEKAKARREILGKLGAPDQPDAFKLDEILPEGIRANAHYAEYRDKLGKVLVEAGMMPETLKAIYDVEHELAGILGQDYEKAKTEGVKALRAKVPGGDEGWKGYKEQAALAATKYGSEALAQLIADEENPALMNAMHELWDHTLREGTTKPGGEVPQLRDTGQPAMFSNEWYNRPQSEAAAK